MRSRLAWLILSFIVCTSFPGCGGDSDNNPPPAGGNPPAGPGPTPDPIDPPGDSEPGWIAQVSNAASALTTICAVNPDRAWAAGWTAGVRRTEDGGATWAPMGQAVDGIKKIEFLDDLHGWAITGYLVMSTSDGGETWMTRKTAGQNPYSAISFINPSTGWVAAQNYEVFKTTDGGETWTSLPVAPPANGALRALRALKFVDAQTGWIATSHHQSGEAILKTTDGGTTWQQQYTVGGSGTVLYDITAVDAGRAWAVGALTDGNFGELMVATTNGGETWTTQQSDGSSAMMGVHFVSASLGWAVGQKIHRTTDGGATWTIQASPSAWYFDVTFVNATTGWVVGTDGIILKTTTGGE